MRKGFAALAVVGVAATVALFAMTSFTPKAVTMYTQEDEFAFIQFIAKYGKSYVSKNEHTKRAEIFKENMQKIREENLRGENAFTLGVNRFADMNEVDFKREKVNNMNSYNLKAASLG
jgi:glutamine cyclotransferase